MQFSIQSTKRKKVILVKDDNDDDDDDDTKPGTKIGGRDEESQTSKRVKRIQVFELKQDVEKKAAMKEEDDDENNDDKLVIPLLVSTIDEKSAPLLVRTKPKEFLQVNNEFERFQIDVNSRPDELETSDDAYKRIPVDKFGDAILRGMNFDPRLGIGIGPRARLIKPQSFSGRPTLLGLGAKQLEQASSTSTSN